jgi:primosomal protein N' (replication factor Y)
MARRARRDKQLRLIETPIDETPRPVAKVAVERPIDRLYSYGVPEPIRRDLQPGKRVLVPFGKGEKLVRGVCVSITPEAVVTGLRNVEEVIDEAPLFSDRLLELGEWISEYYCCPIGTTLAAMTPAPVKQEAGFKTIRVARALADRSTLADDSQRVTSKQQAVMELLWANPSGEMSVDELKRAANVGDSPIKTLVKHGLLAVEPHRLDPDDLDEHSVETPDYELTVDQREALDQVRTSLARDRFESVMLLGVTGSGKTEVYIQAIQDVLRRGRQAIVLAPEIALTTQAADRLSRRFARTSVLHASLPPARRARAWRAMAAGRVDVVIGTRSAIFAPLPNLGLIVVDEEQESSYKNLANPRYHTRDVAAKRAQLERIPVVLCSATPSLETWWNCKSRDHFRRVDLPNRVMGLSMPRVELVDMVKAEPDDRYVERILSASLATALQETVEADQQSVLLLNRRGYTQMVRCVSCAHVFLCEHCRRTLVYHRKTRRLLCHWCRFELPEPRVCEVMGCGGRVVPVGMGTQRVWEEVQERVPAARAARLDSDAPDELGETAPAGYQKILEDFETGRTNVLIGTQMVAKGLDFPHVTLVGVVDADTSISSADFRSAERTFQLAAQVAGRAGRAHLSGRVIIQSRHVAQPALQCALNHDYVGFADQELSHRQSAGLPPATRMARVVLADPAHRRAQAAAEELANRISALKQRREIPARLWGPFPAPVERIRDLYRFDLRIVADGASELREALRLLRGQKAFNLSARSVVIDVDPVNLL